MTLTLGITLGAIIALLALSAFFSGSETALTAVSKARMQQLEKNGDTRAGRVNVLLESRDKLIGALLLGNNLVNILASALSTNILLNIFGDVGVAYATLIMTALVLVFSEVLPKTYALANSDQSALRIAPLVQLIVKLLSPFIAIVQFVVRLLLRLGGSRLGAEDNLLSPREDIRGTIELHHREGGVIKDDRDMLGGILDLDEMDISDVMVHRTDVIAVDAGQPVEAAVEEILESQFSRIPLWSGEPDNFIGILHTRDLAKELARVKGRIRNIDLTKISASPWFVPETTSLQDQLGAFLQRKTHFAVVVDEYGEVMGIVTLEDILEEIVGEISDEHDVDIVGLRQQSDGSTIIDGSIPIRDINRALDWHLPEDEATTIAGLVIHEARIIPDVGQVFTFHGFKFEVLGKQRNQLTSIRLTPINLEAAARPAPAS
jgi:magnesium and cobalt exporter, CNNM family